MRRCAVDATTQNVEPADAPGEFTQGDGQKSGAAGDVRRLGRSPLHRYRVPDHLETIPGHRLGLERAGTASRGTMCADVHLAQPVELLSVIGRPQAAWSPMAGRHPRAGGNNRGRESGASRATPSRGTMPVAISIEGIKHDTVGAAWNEGRTATALSLSGIEHPTGSVD
jgi:hypothetical protein